MNKLKTYIIFSLLIFAVGAYFYHRTIVNNLEQEIFTTREEVKKDLKKVRDSAFVEIKNLTKNSEKRFDSIINIPPKIKWKIYEKSIYINRTLDDALIVHSNHKTNKGTE